MVLEVATINSDQSDLSESLRKFVALNLIATLKFNRVSLFITLCSALNFCLIGGAKWNGKTRVNCFHT